MTTVQMQWLGFSALGLCLLLQGCAVGSSDLQYHLALEAEQAGSNPDCTVVLKSVVDETMKGGSGPLGGGSWTIRSAQTQRIVVPPIEALHECGSGCLKTRKTLRHIKTTNPQLTQFLSNIDQTTSDLSGTL